jgi:hypothetical protein
MPNYRPIWPFGAKIKIDGSESKWAALDFGGLPVVN